MKNIYLRSLVYLIVIFIVSELLAFFYLGWMGWHSKGVAIYIVLIIPVMFAVLSVIHFVVLAVCDFTRKHKEGVLTATIVAFVFDVVLLFLASIFSLGGKDLMPGVITLLLCFTCPLILELTMHKKRVNNSL